MSMRVRKWERSPVHRCVWARKQRAREGQKKKGSLFELGDDNRPLGIIFYGGHVALLL